MNSRYLQTRWLPRLARYRVRRNIGRRWRVAGKIKGYDSDHDQRDQTSVEQEFFHVPPETDTFSEAQVRYCRRRMLTAFSVRMARFPSSFS